MKGILKVFAVAVAVAVLGLTLMLMGYATGGPDAARQAMNYTNLSQRHYHGWVPGWLERALGWADDADRWADDFEDDMNDWADDFEDDVDRWADGVEDWADGLHAGQSGVCWGPGAFFD
ncbi:hypothetical protein [Allofournierella sp.]|uniref:hypothetical protein n=1 Tax=Allofournierella sp. TaxID=1940256 RepID=UPI002E79A53B|nr:hypothetical protein [Fournierella sp.]MEE0756142.1 hypothetical protein [Fournierella sp.]